MPLFNILEIVQRRASRASADRVELVTHRLDRLDNLGEGSTEADRCEEKLNNQRVWNEPTV